MLKLERLKKIEESLLANGSVTVSNLSSTLSVTEETIRRDLEQLEKEKKLKRVRGGAFLPDKFDKEVPIQLRENIYTQEKLKISSFCVDYLEEGDSILLDSSTTSVQLAKAIKNSNKKFTVITNSLNISKIFEQCKSVNLICLGGRLRTSSNSFIGSLTLRNLSEYKVDKAFISCSSLDSSFGISDNHEEESMVRKKMLEHAHSKFLIVDHTKFDSCSTYKICDFTSIDVIITDKEPLPSWREKFNSLSIKLIY